VGHVCCSVHEHNLEQAEKPFYPEKRGKVKSVGELAATLQQKQIPHTARKMRERVRDDITVTSRQGL
jgi:hypothetical protein